MPRRPSTTTAAPAAAEAADAPTEGARPVVVYRALTAFWLFSNSKREEAKAAGDRALEVPEVMSMWRALSRDEKQVWEERERVEQKRYFNEVRARALSPTTVARTARFCRTHRSSRTHAGAAGPLHRV